MRKIKGKINKNAIFNIAQDETFLIFISNFFISILAQKEVQKMSVFRVEKNKNYTVMSNYHLRDKNLSLKAKGLLSYMLSLPDNWDYSLEGLVKVNKEGLSAIKSTVKELKENNYLEIKKLYGNQTKSGRIDYEYLIFETPKVKKQEVGFLPLENQPLENQLQINTNNKILKKESKKKKKIIKKDLDFEKDIKFYESNKLYEN